MNQMTGICAEIEKEKNAQNDIKQQASEPRRRWFKMDKTNGQMDKRELRKK